MEIIRVALKNVFRNKRRSALNLIALFLASCLMILGLGWVEGYHTYVFRAMQDFESGEVQLIPAGYLEESRRMPLDMNLPDYSILKERLKALPEVREATGRIDFTLRLSNRKESVSLAGRAIDPVSEANTTVLSRYIREGQYLSEEEGGILLGKELAERMGVGPGDTVYLVAEDRFGVENFTDIRVAGIFHLGFPPIDRNVVFLDLASAMTLLDMDNRVTRVVMRMAGGVSPEKGVSLLSRQDLPGEVHTWKTFAQATVSAVAADSNTFYMMLAVLYLLIFLGLLNSMSMSVHERTREIGTLRAIGMKRSRLILMFLMESGWLVILAFVMAVLLSLPVMGFLGGTGLDISSQMPESIPVPFGERFYADFRPWHFLLSFGVAGLSALAGTFRPARKAARMIVADAMRGGGLG